MKTSYIDSWKTSSKFVKTQLGPMRYAFYGQLNGRALTHGSQSRLHLSSDTFNDTSSDTFSLLNLVDAWLQSWLADFLSILVLSIKKGARVLSGLLIVASVLLFSAFIAPELYYRVFPVDTKPIQAREDRSVRGGLFADGAWTKEKIIEIATDTSDAFVKNEPTRPERYIPPQDSNLPEGDWIIIPRIGVRTEYQNTQNPDEALEFGVWKSPEYGLPGQLNMPVIMAAHRFGWDWWWQSEYWRYNSFYLLPDTEPGDRIEIISDQRRWVYEIYAGEEGEKITDYDADLILYTCKFLTSPVRHFRYARLIL